MEIRQVDNNFPKQVWNGKATHPLQAWEWGEARQKMGSEVVRIGEFNGQILLSTYQMTLHPLPFLPFKIGYLPRSAFPDKAVVHFLTEFGKKHSIIFIQLEPYLKKTGGGRPAAGDGLTASPHPLFPAWTQTLDLSKSEPELLANLKSKTRYNINLAQKKGVKVNEASDDKGFRAFSRLYFATCRRQRYFGHDENYHHTIWHALKPSIAHILVADYRNIPLAAYELFFFRDTLYYPYGGTSSEHRNLMASNLLLWESIRLGKRLGATKFDLWGSLPPSYDYRHPWAGFTRFKEGYGTEFVEMIGSFDLVINPVFHQIYQPIYTLREWFLRLKSLV
ncbi:peptidoglycan bridge formation glycyltransferase FemA/FemB family protein [Candidatus Roizmanbacteria bacterium]|nr:peptidoglycan bridge formation glycyltransferase FemA/FemB family protein [Candidatus Roizmanbacteria bacterium]